MCAFGGCSSRRRLFVVSGALMLFVRKQRVRALGLLRYSHCQHFVAGVAEMGGLALTSSQ